MHTIVGILDNANAYITMSENKQMTIEDLARITQKGFEETAKKGEVEKRFEEVDKRFDEMDTRFDLVEGRLDAIDVELIYIKKKLDNIVYRHEFELLKDRIGVLEQKVAARSRLR